jgi:hypothetical protein
MRPLALALSLLVLWTSAGAATAGPLSNWAAVVVAGDFRAHSGGPSEAFDNARRDVTTALAKAGFEAGNIRQFSTRPERYPDARPGRSDIASIYAGLEAAAKTAKGGCLFYLTSHGAPQGAMLDEMVLLPTVLEGVLNETCAERPTVAVISACYSGVFVPQIQAPNRMILTAARRDRTSFGCGEDDKYPYFDDCFLQSLPRAQDFADLGKVVRTCVADREKAEGAKPPSEPQVWIGPALRPMLPLYAFTK